MPNERTNLTVRSLEAPEAKLASPVNVICLLAWSTLAGQDGKLATVVMSGVVHVHYKRNVVWPWR